MSMTETAGRSRASTKKTTPPVDWKAGHGVLTGTINGVGGALTCAAVGHAAGMPAGWALAAGAAGAMGTIAAGLKRRLTSATLTFRASCWMAAGGWTSWALSHGGPWTWENGGALAVAGLVAGTAAAGFAAHEEVEQERRRTMLLIGARRQLAEEWIDRLHRICRIEGAAIPAIEQWKSGFGYTVEVELPGGITRRSVADHADALASDLDVPLGGGVQVMPGVSRRRVLIQVQTASTAGLEIPFPMDDLSDLTVNNLVPAGLLSAGDVAGIDLRQASTIVTGPTGTGKTNWLHTVIAHLARTTDTLVWVIDLNGGSIGLPWLHAWREAQQGSEGSRWAGADIPVPGVDWVASTPAEATLMVKAAVRIAKRRKVVYQDRMRAANTDILPVGPDVPEIVIIMDEGAEVTLTREARAVMAGVSEVTRIARAMAIRTILSMLRVTQDILSDPVLRKMASNRVATGANEDSELGHLFGWRALKAEDSFAGPGSLLVGVEGKQPNKAQQWRILPTMIEEITAETSARRPTLDKPSLEAAGDAYADRWLLERCGHLWAANTANTANTDVSEANTPREWKATAGWDKPRTPSVAELEAMWEAEPGNDQDRPEGVDWADPSTWRTGRETPQPEQPDARQAALMLILVAGPEGTGASALERELKPDFGTTRQTIVGWLKQWAEMGEVVRVGEGSKARYVHRRHAPEPPTEG
jgi:hypothetical protein